MFHHTQMDGIPAAEFLERLQWEIMDERFTAYYDKQVPGCARFLRDAVVHWVK